MAEVYKITNIVNNKCYIGITKNNFRKRYNHRDDWWNMTHNEYLKNSVNKYGVENFIIEILETPDEELLEEREKFYISQFNSIFPNGYNFSGGGNYNRITLDSTREKISKSKKGVPSTKKGIRVSEEIRARNKASILKRYAEGEVPWNKGLKTGRPSEEAIEASAAAHRKKVGQYTREGELIQSFDSIASTRNQGFDPTMVCNVCRGKYKHHRGYVFKYI